MSSTKPVVFTTLWQPDDAFSKRHIHGYNLHHVERFVKNVYRHLGVSVDIVVLVDKYWMDRVMDGEAEAVWPTRFIEVEGLCGGWSMVMEGFNPVHGFPRGCWCGLDTVFMNNWYDILTCDLPVGLPKDPYMRGKPCNAVTTFTRAAADLMYFTYVKRILDTKEWWEGSLMAGQFSEMCFQRLLWAQEGWKTLNDLFPGRLISYKAHFKTNPCSLKQASVVYFHGTPKMWDLPVDDPVAKEWLRND